MATQILLRNVIFWVVGILFFADNYVTYIILGVRFSLSFRLHLWYVYLRSY